jgi:hypothetical protein
VKRRCEEQARAAEMAGEGARKDGEMFQQQR